ncbi:MAG: ArdC family protein [Exiguobacterium sp.]|jgi:antirestriction protein ArdC
MNSKQMPSELLVEKLVEAIESGIKTQRWVRPWKTGQAQNALTNHIYSGNNAMYLAVYRAFAGVEHTQYYATMKQWNELNARVKKGESGLTLVKNPTRVEKKDKETKEVIGTYTFWANFTVFNSSQVEGWEPPTNAQVESDEKVRNNFATLVQRHGIKVNTGSEAFYRPSSDEITMPPVADFPIEDNYWAVLAHEAVHWTGHPARLNRIEIGNHSGDKYAFEELVAELGSVFVASTLGITPESDANILSYLDSWHSQLKNDKTAVRRALALANEAAQYLDKGGE